MSLNIQTTHNLLNTTFPPLNFDSSPLAVGITPRPISKPAMMHDKLSNKYLNQSKLREAKKKVFKISSASTHFVGVSLLYR